MLNYLIIDPAVAWLSSRLRFFALVARWSVAHSIGYEPAVARVVWEAWQLEPIQVFSSIVTVGSLVNPTNQAPVWAHTPT